MSAQDRALRDAGIDVRRSNVYPVIKECDIPKALDIFWSFKVEGWWHYKEKFVLHKICTAQEFDDALDRRVEADKLERERFK